MDDEHESASKKLRVDKHANRDAEDQAVHLGRENLCVSVQKASQEPCLTEKDQIIQLVDEGIDAIEALKGCVAVAVKTRSRFPDLTATDAASSIRWQGGWEPTQPSLKLAQPSIKEHNAHFPIAKAKKISVNDGNLRAATGKALGRSVRLDLSLASVCETLKASLPGMPYGTAHIPCAPRDGLGKACCVLVGHPEESAGQLNALFILVDVNAHRGMCKYKHSEKARSPHTNGPRGMPRCGALSLLQKPPHHIRTQKNYFPALL